MTSRDCFSVSSYRNKGFSGDPRIGVLSADLFNGKKCLDVGCNSGLFTLDLVVTFDIVSMKGIDIDASLIEKANKNQEKYETFDPKF